MSRHDWLQPNGPSPSLYVRLQRNLEAAIRSGELKPGSRLPPERQLAGQLQVSRTTVTNAYRELEAKGLVRGFVGRGTYVCAVPEATDVPFAWHGKMSEAAMQLNRPGTILQHHPGDSKLISFALGSAALECFPVEEYRRIEHPMLTRHFSDALGPAALTGQPALRRAIAAEHTVRTEQVLVISGSQQGLDLVARSFVEPGDHVIVEKPGYFVAFRTFLAAGARLVGWDAVRSDMGELEDLILRYRPKFICATPTFQNPTARTLSLSQRQELIELAVRYHIPLIEDEPYRDLYFESPPPHSLHALDECGIVIHLRTYSTALGPGFRLGYIIAPEEVVNLLALAKQRSSSLTGGLEQLVLAEMLGSGALAAHLERLRREHRIRRDAMMAALLQALPRNLLTFSEPNGGLYLWARLAKIINTSELNRLAMREGVAFAPGELFYPEAAETQEMRFCFAGSTVPRILEGAERLKNVIRRALPSP
jgi:2-aminoadipate transaminase